MPVVLAYHESISNSSAPSTPKTCNLDTLEDIKRWIDTALSIRGPMSQNDIKAKVFGDIGKQKNSSKQKADMKIAITNGLLEESTIKKNGYPYAPAPDDSELGPIPLNT